VPETSPTVLERLIQFHRTIFPGAVRRAPEPADRRQHIWPSPEDRVGPRPWDQSSFASRLVALGGIFLVSIWEGGKVGQILQPTAARIVFSGTSRLAEVGKARTELIRFVGHTDDIAIHAGRLESKGEPSTARVSDLISIFVERFAWKASASRPRYAEFHPVATNETPEDRGKNRRAGIVVLDRTRSSPSRRTGPGYSCQEFGRKNQTILLPACPSQLAACVEALLRRWRLSHHLQLWS
jgi:hypothetical protein